jgi:hypothetical protein
MRILVQFPTRERVARFAAAHKALVDLAARPSELMFQYVIDEDDRPMLEYLVSHMSMRLSRIAVGPRVSKIEACNRGLSDFPHAWDIVVLVSDDMVCHVRGWDDIIRADMAEHFPDTDGCLWYPDGHQNGLCTLPVVGRKYLDRNTIDGHA